MTPKRKKLFADFREKIRVFLAKCEEERIARIELVYGMKDKEMRKQFLEKFNVKARDSKIS